jgi:hypothetical protein
MPHAMTRLTPHFPPHLPPRPTAPPSVEDTAPSTATSATSLDILGRNALTGASHAITE